VNLLNGDNLSVLFNEDGSSKLDITGLTDTAAGLGLTPLATTAFDTNTSINATLDDLKGTLDTLRTQASQLGSNLSIIETRQDFTKNMINVLETGASNLTLADTNEEAANVLALQTRQQLSSTALSLSSQADQNVLRLFS
jgi:flagellin-like hook-associated protein FlgL